MIWMFLVFAACAAAVIAYTFRISRRLEETDRRAAELRERIEPGDTP